MVLGTSMDEVTPLLGEFGAALLVALVAPGCYLLHNAS